MFFKNVKFQKLWQKAFEENADTFTGLYNSVLKIAEAPSKRKDKPFHELWQRAHLKWTGTPIDVISQQIFDELAEKQSDKAYKKTANRLLKAMQKAGFTHDVAKQTIKLTNSNILAYKEWDGNDIYEDDVVSVMLPAWYQNGKVIETGICTLVKEPENRNEQDR